MFSKVLMTILIIGVAATGLLTALITSVTAYAQNTQSGDTTLHIIKDATNSYTISSGASFIGAFDTTYSIKGSGSSMGASKDLIISTITDDFGNSPTIGYVNNTSSPSPASQSNLNQSGLSNPFAAKAAIDERIRNEITSSIDNAAAESAEGEIKCIFGSSLDDFKCSFHRLSS